LIFSCQGDGAEEKAEGASRMAVDRKDDKVKQDLPKLTEQHEGLPGYLDHVQPSTSASEQLGDSKGS
jgi:hypothetical protein